MATIGSLSILVGTDLTKLKRGMGQASRMVGGFVASIQSTRRSLLGLAGGVTALVGAGGLIALVRMQFNAADAAVDLANKLDINVQRLTELQHAAVMTDTEIESLEKGLGFLARNLGENDKVFRTLGLDAKQLIQMPLDEAFLEVADAISQMPTASDQAVAAFRVFGKGGVELLNMLKQGKEGLKIFADEANRFGLAINQVDARAIQAADDSMKRMKATIMGLGRQAAVQLAPALEAAANAFVQMIEAAGGSRAVISSVIDGMVNGFLAVVDAIHAMRVAWADFIVQLRKLQAFDREAKKHPLMPNLGMIQQAQEVKIDAQGRNPLQRALADAADIRNQNPADRMRRNIGDFRNRLAGQELLGAMQNMIPMPFGGVGQIQPGRGGGKGGFAAAEEAIKMADGIASFEAELRKSIATFGMGEEAAKLFELAQKGANEEQLAGARVLIKELEARRQLHELDEDFAKKVLGQDKKRTELPQAAEKGSAEAAAIIAQASNPMIQEQKKTNVKAEQIIAAVKGVRDALLGAGGIILPQI